METKIKGYVSIPEEIEQKRGNITTYEIKIAKKKVNGIVPVVAQQGKYYLFRYETTKSYVIQIGDYKTIQLVKKYPKKVEILCEVKKGMSNIDVLKSLVKTQGHSKFDLDNDVLSFWLNEISRA